LGSLLFIKEHRKLSKMADITGTQGKNTLTGTAADDKILGLGGNDIIIGSSGEDVIDGGTGNNVLDYSNFVVTDKSNGIGLFLSPSGALKIVKSSIEGQEGNTDTDTIINITKVIGNPTIPPRGTFPSTNFISVSIGGSGSSDPGDPQIDVDLSRNRLTYSSPLIGTKTIAIDNFSTVFGGNANDRIKGNDLNNEIIGGGGDDLMIASKGDDSLSGETIDYSKIGTAITVKANWSIGGGGKFGFTRFFFNQNIEKGMFGQDFIRGAKKIIGANNQSNTLDASSGFNSLSMNVNLATNFLQVNDVPKDLPLAPDASPTQIEIINFTNVIGTRSNDTIVGANKKGKLTGGGGSDNITGGNKNDTITGSDSTARGVGEVDTLTGGGGRDRFVLGDVNGAYYVSKGKDDYATITDFNLFQDSIDLGGFKDYSFASGGNNTIELYSGKDVNTRDLIAKIQIAGGISSASSNSRSVMGSDASLNAITSKIDILQSAGSNND
jgi:Ca2+-binding RTX toxin-like protein